jgi:hypothetical protein
MTIGLIAALALVLAIAALIRDAIGAIARNRKRQVALEVAG